jgi:hypothetical protein
MNWDHERGRDHAASDFGFGLRISFGTSAFGFRKKAFAEVTRANLNKQLAILIDGNVVSAPLIRTEIRDGKAIIDGNFTQKEAEALASTINKAVQGKQDGKIPWRHGLYDGRAR